jgi:ABC-type Mn2+/Zn2+ transport system permease subunit/Mn-dependent DtxR family transcriptional regulator
LANKLPLLQSRIPKEPTNKNRIQLHILIHIMEELLQVLQSEWAIRALIASSLVGTMCGVLGCFIVLRNMALIGDALSHAILPGVVVAFMVLGTYSALGFFVGSVLAGLITATGITWLQHNVNTKNDAAIGIVFTAMFGLGVMGISAISQQEGVHLDLKDFLFGNILGVSNEDLYITAATTLYVLVSVVVFYRYLFISTFQPVIAQTMGINTKVIHYFLMLLLSFAVVASLQTVGVILVVAMLVTPASTALLLSNELNKVIWISGVVGLLSAILGFLLAVQLDTTPGPAMAVTATLLYLIAVFFAPESGLVFRFFQKRKLRSKIQLEDTLKQAIRLQEKEQLTFEKLSERLGFTKATLQSHLKKLSAKDYFTNLNNVLTITPSGQEVANKLVRAHRLWETYLVQQAGMTEDQIHDEAEKYEHLLTEEMLHEVDRELGFPTKDPHGSPIPTNRNFDIDPLFNLDITQEAKIAGDQISEHITNKLWELGLTPGMIVRVLRKDKKELFVKTEDGELALTALLAKEINMDL